MALTILLSDEGTNVRTDVLLEQRPQGTLHMKKHPELLNDLTTYLQAAKQDANRMQISNVEYLNGKKWDGQQRQIVDAPTIEQGLYLNLVVGVNK